MKAVVYGGPRNTKVEELPEHKPSQDKVLVRFEAGSICGTDLHNYRGEWKDLEVGRVIGHDASGRIRETGQRVAIVPVIFCGSCRWCLEGRPNLCERWEMMGFNRDGYFS